MHRCRCAERPKDTELRLVGPQDKHRGRHQPRRGFCNNILVSSTYWYLFIITARSLHLSAQGETHLIGKLIAKFPAQPLQDLQQLVKTGVSGTCEMWFWHKGTTSSIDTPHNMQHSKRSLKVAFHRHLPSGRQKQHTLTQTPKPSRCCTFFLIKKH